MLTNEITLTWELIIGSILGIGMIYGLYRWLVRRNRIDSINEIRHQTKSEDSKDN